MTNWPRKILLFLVVAPSLALWLPLAALGLGLLLQSDPFLRLDFGWALGPIMLVGFLGLPVTNFLNGGFIFPEFTSQGIAFDVVFWAVIGLAMWVVVHRTVFRSWPVLVLRPRPGRPPMNPEDY